MYYCSGFRNKQTTAVMKATAVLFMDKGLVRFSAPQGVEGVARYIAKKRINEEGFKFNSKGRAEWLKSEVDYANEVNAYTVNAREYAYTAACNLFYNNAPHIIGEGNKQVPNSFLDECAEYIYRLLESEQVK